MAKSYHRIFFVLKASRRFPQRVETEQKFPLYPDNNTFDRFSKTGQSETSGHFGQDAFRQFPIVCRRDQVQNPAMTLSDLNGSQLHQLIKLLQKKAVLVSRLAQIEQAISALEKPALPMIRTSELMKNLRRKDRKTAILEALRSAGSEGMTIRQLAQQTKSSRPNISVWFSVTGRKMTEIKKIGPATYQYVGLS